MIAAGPRPQVSGFGLQPFRPALASVEHAEDLDATAAQTVRNHVWRPGNDPLPDARKAAGPPEPRKTRELVGRSQQQPGDMFRGLGILARDKCTQGRQVRYGARRPDDGHARGALRSRFFPHERNHAATSAWATD